MIENASTVVVSVVVTLGAIANDFDIPAGDWVRLVDVDKSAAFTLEAAAGTATCYISYSGV